MAFFRDFGFSLNFARLAPAGCAAGRLRRRPD